MSMARWKKSLDTMFQIALDYDKGVDIHLHETTPAGVAAINYMVETVEKNATAEGQADHQSRLCAGNAQRTTGR